jgi:5-methylcytosine-specific restriction enzyme subunit McrC
MTASEQLHLTEHELATGVPLSARDAGLLRAMMPSVSITPSFDGHGYDVKPGSHIGVVSLETCSVVVQPAKVATDRILFLVSYALDPVRWHQRGASYGIAHDLVEGMAALFAHELQRALRRGVLQGYRPTEDALLTVRGRIRFDEQLRRRFGRTIPLEVRFDEYTEDTDLNRVLRAALWRLSRLPIRSRQVRSVLAFCSSVFADTVTLVNYEPRTIPRLTWNRLNQHYRIAGKLALLILAATSIELVGEEARGPSFVIDMNTVFEEFVRTALREALGLATDQFPPPGPTTIHLDQRQMVRIKPDLTWWRQGTCVFVGDAKYKRLDLSGIGHADLYQLLAYTIALDLPAGLLVYAVGEAKDAEHAVRHAGKTLHVTTIDLSGSPKEILQDVGRIAEQVRALASAGMSHAGASLLR